MKVLNVGAVIFFLAACVPPEGKQDVKPDNSDILFSDACPAVDSAESAEARFSSGSAIALDTCLKAQPNLANWTFSSTLGQSPSPIFRVLKIASSSRINAGACTTTTANLEQSIVVFGKGNDRKLISAAVDNCLSDIDG